MEKKRLSKYMFCYGVYNLWRIIILHNKTKKKNLQTLHHRLFFSKLSPITLDIYLPNF